MSGGPTPSRPGALRTLRDWFWRPPRAHGEVEPDRTVSFLELFYDLVYVVVIAQAAHHLAGHVSLQAAIEFAIVFGLVWIAWLNGTLYVDLHGQGDGRTRTFVFVQMALLALLAVFTGDAAGETGVEFAIVYAAFVAVIGWLWYTVRRRDRETGRDEYMAITRMYLGGIIATLAVVLASALLPEDLRTTVWGIVVVSWLGAILLRGMVRPSSAIELTAPTDSIVERIGLFTIIVLGEVVVGVVDGMGEVELDPTAMATGFFALVVGFGLWWLYFDGAGRRLPRAEPGPYTRWMVGNYPVTLGIAAAGAAMVGLVGHAHEPTTPADTAWLLGGSVALALAGLVVVVYSLVDFERVSIVYRPAVIALGVGAIVALALAYLQPPPWLLALGLALDLLVVWLVAIVRWLRLRGPSADAYDETAG